MSLIGALNLILNGRLDSDLDCNHKRLLNLDTSNLSTSSSYGPQAAHAVFIGPTSGTGVPGFRVPTVSEFGGQQHSPNLDIYSGLVPTTPARDFLTTITAPGSSSFLNYASGAYAWRTLSQVRSDISAQPLHANLTAIAGATLPSAGGLSALAIATPGSPSFLQISAAGVASLRTFAQTISDLAVIGAPFTDSTALIKGSADATKLLRFEIDGFTTGATRVLTPPNYDGVIATLQGTEGLRNKTVNGLGFLVADTPSPDGALTNTDTPGLPYLFKPVSIGGSGLSLTLRAYNPTDLVLPSTGTLATVAGTIPWTYFDTKSDLGGKDASDVKSSSQLAVYTFVNAHSGHILPNTASDVVSAATVDLTATTDYQLLMKGTNTISAITLNEGQERLLLFESGLTLVHGGSFVLPGGLNLTTKAGTYAVVRGGEGADVGKTFVLVFSGAGSSGADPKAKIANFVGGSITELTSLGVRYIGGTFDLRIANADAGATDNRTLQLVLNDASRTMSIAGDITLAGTFITQAAINFAAGGPVAVTLPTTGTLATLAGAELLTNKTVNGIKFYSGSGSPEGAVTAAIGSLYTNTAGGTSTTLYVKTSGAGNTGWTAK